MRRMRRSSLSVLREGRWGNVGGDVMLTYLVCIYGADLVSTKICRT